ncbi:MAG TPA: ferritin-like domain-containing protein [Acidobacteriaceae bacterium]|nr:ferritin-like domain-containing protein [Acidobacteriaceae bacterium]
MNTLVELAEKRINRRKFLAGVGAAGAATALAGCQSTGVNPGPTVNVGLVDTDYLNFALNLEYLEAEFYLRAATGQGLLPADNSATLNAVTIPAGTVVGGAKISGLSAAQQNILNELAYDEQAHVRDLRLLLSGLSTSSLTAAVSLPNLDFTNGFNAVASAAGIGSTFNPFQDWDHFLVGAFLFEDVGVTAYNGIAPLISPIGVAGPTNFLANAAAILAVESYHAATIRATIVGNTVAAGGVSNYPYFTYANQISTLRGTLGGGNETPLTLPGGTTSSPTASTIVPATTTNATAFSRTTDQILHIVYGKAGAGVSSGGFFPNGMNGHITVTQS